MSCQCRPPVKKNFDRTYPSPRGTWCAARGVRDGCGPRSAGRPAALDHDLTAEVPGALADQSTSLLEGHGVDARGDGACGVLGAFLCALASCSLFGDLGGLLPELLSPSFGLFLQQALTAFLGRLPGDALGAPLDDLLPQTHADPGAALERVADAGI